MFYISEQLKSFDDIGITTIFLLLFVKYRYVHKKAVSQYGS